MVEISPKKCCIRYDPPTLILFYEIKSSGKLHRRSIPLRHVDFEQTTEHEIVDDLKRTHHSKYINVFNVVQIKRLLKLLIEKNGGLNIDLVSPIDYKKDDTNKSVLDTLDIERTDLNKLGDDELNVVKEEMDGDFIKNQVKPGDEGWKYDHEVDFPVNHGEIESSPWDDDDDSDMEF